MSKSVSRRTRHALAKGKGLGATVAANMSGPKPGKSLERSHAAPNRLGALSPRFNDPAGNVFTARTIGRTRHDSLVSEQGPLVFSIGPDGVKRCSRDKSLALSRAGSAPAPFQPSDYSTVNVQNNPCAPMPAYRLERANRSAFLASKTQEEAIYHEIYAPSLHTDHTGRAATNSKG